jgi:Tfp pilus assembly protein PilO
LPQMAAIDNVKDQIQKLSQNTQQVISDTQRMKPIRKNLQDERDQLRAISDKIRSIQEVPLILSTISSIASEYGVKIDQLTPEKDLQKNLATTAAYGKYYALPVVIKAHCGYHKFGQFLNKLESEDLFFIMQDFIIQNDATQPNTRSFSVTIEMILVDRAS